MKIEEHGRSEFYKNPHDNDKRSLKCAEIIMIFDK